MLAIIFVKYDLFSRFGNKPKGVLSVVEAVLLVLASLLFAHWKVYLSKSDFSEISTLFSALSVALLCLFVQKYVTAGWLEKALAFIGKHSGNIYLVHMAVYRYWSEIVFCTKSVLGSVTLLLGISLLISIALEALKKLIRYDQFINFLSGKLLSAISPTSKAN